MSNIEIIFSEFKQLTPTQLHDLFRVRQQVFIIEQSCFYEDIDGSDEQAHHLLIYKNEELAGYLRLFAPKAKYEEYSSLGRIVVSTAYRGTAIGKTLIEEGLKKAINLFPGNPIKIEAQAALTSYYNRYGFKETGEVYIVDNIPHQLMILSPN